eukprot:UN3551
MLSSGFHFFMYQMSSFWVLSCVQPITHSVLNTLKRVVIIIVSILVFRNPVTAQSVAGTGIAIAGVLIYSLTKSYFSKKGNKWTGRRACLRPTQGASLALQLRGLGVAAIPMGPMGVCPRGLVSPAEIHAIRAALRQFWGQLPQDASRRSLSHLPDRSGWRSDALQCCGK